MELFTLSLPDLRTLQENVKQELKRREHKDLADARAQILAIAQAAGMSVQDLVGSGVKVKSTKKVAVRYRSPDDGTQEWTGRGRRPKWVQAWLDAGKSLDALRV